MSIDLSQFHQVFFEESFEGLEVMEQSLLGLTPNNVDPETINTIFRAAHSIKGGSATFKFDQVAEFTHILETLLDEMRNGERDVTVEAIDLLLQAGDCLREMLTTLQQGSVLEALVYSEIADKLNSMINNDSATSNQQAAAETIDLDAQQRSTSSVPVDDNELFVWKIIFIPEAQILRTGNEPIRMFRELELLGDIHCVANGANVPRFSQLEEDGCYLSWTIYLVSDTEIEPINEVFEWVADECELAIEKIPQSQFEAILAGTDESAEVNSAALEQLITPATASQLETASSDDSVLPFKEPVATDVLTSSKVLQVPPKAALKGQEKAAAKPVATSNSSIRVGIDKVDSLINLVGELVITQSMLGQMGDDFNINKLERLREGLSQLEQNTRELQESVMQIRMLPISFIFNRFPRMIRDLSGKLGKKVELEIFGENTELDKTVMEQIGDPMVHLVRNSMDHGVEMPEQRIANGKDEIGKVTLNAFHQGGSIVIEITDDGAGIDKEKVKAKAIERGLISASSELTDEQIYQLIFEPGFSTADQISDVSGRGVGMDVVKKNINALGGSVEVTSQPGLGSTFTIRLPLTLAILDGQLVRVGEQIYVVPLTSIIESLQINS
ncbi:MAG: chemotaxis protein CheA, partial [Kangiellaceae bacterium]|nr:chemotaxis protein CheA [Kangiellaceae bacterium]